MFSDSMSGSKPDDLCAPRGLLRALSQGTLEEDRDCTASAPLLGHFCSGNGFPLIALESPLL